jgi:hypothetical protein
MKRLLVALAVLLALFVLVTLVGAGMEAEHVAHGSRLFGAPPERVWSALLSIRQLPLDRSDLRNIESASEKDRVPESIEVMGSPVKIEAPTQRPPAELVVTTVERDLPFSGTWTFQLAPEVNGTRLTIVEAATIRSRPLRFFVKTILGEDVLMEGIFRAVKRKLSEVPRTTGGD